MCECYTQAVCGCTLLTLLTMISCVYFILMVSHSSVFSNSPEHNTFFVFAFVAIEKSLFIVLTHSHYIYLNEVLDQFLPNV